MNKTIKFLSVYSVLAIAMATGGAFSATTSARPSIASTASRVKVAGGASTMRTPTATVPKTTTTPTPTAPETEAMPDPEPEPERVIVVDNKTSQFDDVLSDIAGIAPDSSTSDLAERVRQQRALLDGASNSTPETSGIKMGANACDSGLRKCMAEKCGNDFTKCANDSTAIWGDKMDSCRRTTNCTGHEYSLLAPEILADRDMNVRMSYYNSVLNCGNRYNSCIFNECGKYMDKCLAKSDGDRAVAKCESIARECREQDSGLASRVMSAFGGLRTIATEQVKKDEARLYELRDLMRTQCNRLGAMFDERTLDCVYTVNFFAGDDTETPKASKKLYAGDTFQCNANWFGVDVTTFKENAYRLTRSQTSASAAMLGAGVGTAAGLVSSGAVDRAIATQRAETAAKDACTKDGGTWKDSKCEKGENNNTPKKDDKDNVDKNGWEQVNKETNKSTSVRQVANKLLQNNGISDTMQNTIASATQPQQNNNVTPTVAPAVAAAATATTANSNTDSNSNTNNTEEQKKTEKTDANPTLTAQSATSTAPAPQQQNNSQCNATYFRQLAASVERDKEIKLPTCSEQNLNTLKTLLDNACTRIPIIHILNTDNKSITELLRDPKHDINNSTFTCATRKFSRKSLNFNKLPVDQWDAESDPDADKCSKECAKIPQLLTEKNKTHEFTNPQCLKQCAPFVKDACTKIGAEYAMYQLYPVTMKFEYWCSQYNN